MRKLLVVLLFVCAISHVVFAGNTTSVKLVAAIPAEYKDSAGQSWRSVIFAVRGEMTSSHAVNNMSCRIIYRTVSPTKTGSWRDVYLDHYGMNFGVYDYYPASPQKPPIQGYSIWRRTLTLPVGNDPTCDRYWATNAYLEFYIAYGSVSGKGIGWTENNNGAYFKVAPWKAGMAGIVEDGISLLSARLVKTNNTLRVEGALAVQKNALSQVAGIRQPVPVNNMYGYDWRYTFAKYWFDFSALGGGDCQVWAFSAPYTGYKAVNMFGDPMLIFQACRLDSSWKLTVDESPISALSSLTPAATYFVDPYYQFIE
ncbi:MAG: hypothetical protein KKC51_12210 [Verrucomicrobia bacterium]|nr:hypothetical protein [Verrucomicrobiota bacterium]